MNNQRRSSVPCENLNRLSFNGKSRNRKKILRRRSSGGAEILSPIMSETSTTIGGDQASSGGNSGTPWYRFKRRNDNDALLSRRRGSLPVEVLSVCHTSGELLLLLFALTINYTRVL